MSHFQHNIRLQRTILKSLGFPFLEEEPDFGALIPMAEEPPPPQKGAPVPRSHVGITAAAEKRTGRATPSLNARGLVSDSDRGAGLTAVITEAAACAKCGLHLTRKRAVAGEGSLSARLFLIGEAPSEEDDHAGLPFRGGELEDLMTKMLKAMGFSREEVYITHAVKCRPPQGRSPDEGELESCHAFLARQVEMVHPEVIICFGQAALMSLLADEEARSLSKCRGRWMSYRGVGVMPTFSLPYIARNRERKKTVWDDLQLVMKRLSGEQ